MKQALSLITFLLIGDMLAGQTWGSLDTLMPNQEYENIHVHRLSNDKYASAFVIWVKKEVNAHLHETHAESIYVLQGEADMLVGADTLRIHSGSYVFIPQNTVHRVKVISSAPLKVISIQAPEFNGTDRVFIPED